MKKSLPSISILFDSSRGYYIPKAFSELEGWEGISKKDKNILQAGPNNNLYWETWNYVLDNAKFKKDDNTWFLYQDGDLFAICKELMTREEKLILE